MSSLGYLPLYVLIVVLSACSASKSSKTDSSDLLLEPVSFLKDRVLILQIALTPTTATLRNAKVVEGTFQGLSESLGQPESMRIQYLDLQKRILFEKILQNPLVQYHEYEEDGQMKRVRTEVQESSVLLRSQHSAQIKYLRIDYGVDNNYAFVELLPLELH